MKTQAQDLSRFLTHVKLKTLKNGLQVLYYPYYRSDVITVNLCVKVGSTYETEKEAGITHLIEHMIFKGTETRKPDEIVGAIEDLGGYMNAFTSYDYTCYYVVGPSEIAETALDVLSDVVFHPYFDPVELEREKQVVLEEMKMRLDNPSVVLFEAVAKKFYTHYPYRRPIIGYENTVKSFTREDLLNYVHKFYTPQNMLLVVVGNIGEKKLFSLVKQKFAGIPEKPLAKVSFPEEPYPSKPELVWVQRDVKEGYFELAFPGPSIKSDDAPLMDLLSEILGGGEASRLYLNVKREKGLVNSISAYSFTPIGPGMFDISGTTSPEKFTKALKAILEEIELIKSIPPSEEELKRAKIKVLSDFIYSQETSEGLSRTLGNFQLTRGNYTDIKWYVHKIETATPEDISRVARKYLNFKKMVVGFLSEKKLFGEKELTQIIDEVLSNKPKVFTLKDGLKLIVVPQRDIPTVGISLVFPGGVRFETKQTNGLFKALSLLWTRGTMHYSAEEISRMLESLGGSINGFSGSNTFGLKAIFLSKNLDKGLEILADIIKNPAFSQEECEKARPELLSLLLKQQDNPLSLAIKDFLSGIFPDHSYGLNRAGSREFYLHFSSDDLKKAYKEFAVPSRGVITVVGDVEPDYIKEKLNSLLEDFKDSPQAFKGEEKEPSLPKIHEQKIKKDAFQTQILLGFQTPGINSKEKVALEVLSSALSGQDGRLFRILRDEKALAYTVTSLVVFYPKRSAFIFYIACSPEKTKEAIQGFWEILEDVSKNGLTKEEIERGKKRLLGEAKVSLQSNIAKAEDMSVNQVLGLGWDYYKKFEKQVNKVSEEDIKELLKKYFSKDRSFLLILGK